MRSNTAQSVSQTRPLVGRSKWQRLIRSTALHNGLVAWLLVGLSFGLSYGLSFELSLDLRLVLSDALRIGLNDGLRVGLIYGLSAGFLSLLLIGKSITVQLTDRLQLVVDKSWTKPALTPAGSSGLADSSFTRAGYSADRRGLSWLLDQGMDFRPSSWLGKVLVGALGIGLSLGLSYWLLIGLFQGVSSEIIDDQQRMTPNQGIHRSAYNGLMLGCISAVIAGLCFWPNWGLSPWLVCSSRRAIRRADCRAKRRTAGRTAQGRIGLFAALCPTLSALAHRLSPVEIPPFPRLCRRSHLTAQSGRWLHIPPSASARLLCRTGNRASVQ